MSSSSTETSSVAGSEAIFSHLRDACSLILRPALPLVMISP